MCKKKVKLNVYYRDTKETEEMTSKQFLRRYGL
jgi:hypothetical protein